MAYQHNIINQGGNVIMTHDRLTVRPSSGLEIVNTIAHTTPVMQPRPAQQYTGELIVMHTLARNTAEVFDTAEPAKSTQCDTLDEFITKGVDCWKRIAALGSIASVNLVLAERIKWTDKTTPAGIILPEPPELNFQGFFATPDEIKALEEMAQQVRLLLNPTKTGNVAANSHLYV